MQNLVNDKNIEDISKSPSLKEINKEIIDNNNVTQLNEILLTTAKISLLCKRKSDKSKPPKEHKKYNWFNEDYQSRRVAVRKYGRILSRKRFCRRNFDLFEKARSAYKKTLRKAEKDYLGFLTKKLMNIGENDPRLFRSIVNKMNKWGKEQTDPANNITHDKRQEHFKTF